MDVLLIFISGALVVIACLAIMNVLIMPRLHPTDVITNAPLVSVLVPARNEANVISQTVTCLLAQDYPNFELIVLNDHSTDNTLSITENASNGDVRFRIINGEALPNGWFGKNWACYQLSQVARGDILVFTDADTRWQPHALNALITSVQLANVDLYTVWTTQETHTWAERLVVPLMGFVVLGYLPIVMTHYTPFSAFAAANGQCMAWKRNAYERIGGHRAVANNVLDDVSLARIAKSHGASLRMADGNQLIQCRMYDSWVSVRDGYAKNILAGYGNSVIALLIATLFHWVIFLLPLMWLFTPTLHLTGFLLLALGILVRALTASFTRQRTQDALLMPLSVLLMTRIAFQSLYWHFTGGARWKGRILQAQKDTPS